MLSGETPRTLRMGLIISVLIIRIETTDNVTVRLDSGIEGQITAEYLSDEMGAKANKMFKKGQTVQVVVVDVQLDLPADHFHVVLSTHFTDLNQGDALFCRVK